MACLVLQSFALGLVFESAGHCCRCAWGKTIGGGESVRWVCGVLRESGVCIANGNVVVRFCSTIRKKSVFTFINFYLFCSRRPTPSIPPTVRPAGVWVPTEHCGEVDSWFVWYAHLLTHPLLAEALVLLVPEAVLLRYVGMLAVAAEETTMFAWVVFMGVAAALGS